MPPLVSIIIPTFNRAHLIGETLDSILAQIYQNWECVVVDDGSTDATFRILEQYSLKDNRFKFISRPVNKPKGANACRNYGYEKSKGDYIQWFDSDDTMHPEKIKIKIDYALAEKADIVVDSHTMEAQIILHENPKVEVFESAEFYVDYILGKKPVITNDVMVRRSVIGSHRFDENLHKAQEYEFFTRLFEQKLKYCFVDQKLSFYRQSVDSISKGSYAGKKSKAESLIYLSKLHIKKFSDHEGIIAKSERQGRKTYKDLMLNNYLDVILKNFNFFRRCHHKSIIVFSAFICYNLITKSGFDVIKPK
ncbi:glycosyltransferase family 2 protein [Rasiella sp. SM2506]|uniref:glycosyltransferase family 2 protein n=1 Tax=Rasiella sp. SM2506 TaxID=3423914 RepID=UPI003D7AFDBC